MNKQRQFPTSQVLAAAIVAFDINGTVVREFMRQDDRDLQPNRLIMLNQLDGDLVTAADIKRAQELKEYLEQTKLLQILQFGKANDFLVNVLEHLQQEKVSQGSFGILAWAPKLMLGLQELEKVKEVRSRYQLTSGYVGRVGERIVIDFTLIQSRYNKNYNGYFVLGHTKDGDLISYWANDRKKVIASGRLQGRVKKQELDSHNNRAKVTYINYVKVL